MSLLGKHLLVEYPLLDGLQVELHGAGEQASLEVSGSIMESAKVFESLRVRRRDGQLLIAVYASLPFWHRRGSPDFRVTQRCPLGPGSYQLLYRSKRSSPVLIKTLTIPA